MCKFTKISFCRKQVRLGSIALLFKYPKVNELVFNLNASLPLATSLVPSHTFEVTAFAFCFRAISYVLAPCGRPNVSPRVIQAIAVLVVVISGLWQASPLCNLAMHRNVFPSGCGSRGIPAIAIGRSAFVGPPLPLHNELVIFRRDSGELSLRKRNNTGSVFHVSHLAGRFVYETTGLPFINLTEHHAKQQA